MLDNLNPHNDGERSSERTHRSPSSEARPVADREVPLSRRTTPAAVHAWLDGELPEAAVRKGDTAKDVEFWQMIAQETSQMRHMRTPAHVEAMIMDALPQTAPQAVSPWYRRELVMTPGTAATSAVILVALTALLTALLLGAGR